MINDTTAREFLFSWNDLNAVITTLSEPDLNHLIKFELEHQNRIYIVERLFQRRSVLTREREWQDLKHIHETNAKAKNAK